MDAPIAPLHWETQWVGRKRKCMISKLTTLSAWGLTMSSWQQKLKTKHWVALWSDLDRSKRTTGDVYLYLYICNCVFVSVSFTCVFESVQLRICEDCCFEVIWTDQNWRLAIDDFKGWVNRCSIQGWTHQISLTFNFYFPQIQNQIRMGWGSQVFRLTKTKMACIYIL